MAAIHPRASMSVPGELIDRIKPLADKDGMTVASWIRHVAGREADRRTGVVVINPAVDADALRHELRRAEYGSPEAGS